MTVPANEYNPIITQSTDTEISIPIPWPYGNNTSNILVTQTNISNGETRNSDEGGFSVVSNFDFTEILVEQYSVFAGENTRYRIQRTLPVQQTYDLTEQGNLSSSALEQALDDNVRLMQDIIQNSVDRVILSDDPFEIANIEQRRGKVFGFDEITGEPVYTGDINDIENISEAVTDAEDAAAEAVLAAQAAELAAADAIAAVDEVAKANSDIIDPTINDDAAAGYTENSLWTNTVDNTAFICVEPTTGAAIWQIIEVVVTSRVVTGAVESPVLEDKGNQIIKDGGGSTTIVVQLDSTLDFPIGTKMQIIANGSGAVDIASDLGVLINGVDAVIFPLDGQYSQVFLQKLGADEWVLFGDFGGGATLIAPTSQVFESDDTWNKPAGLLYIKLSVQAAGGGGGGTANSDRGGQGGAGGGAAVKIIAASALGSSESVTVGVGGTAGTGITTGGAGTSSSFATVSATGGAGGTSDNNAVSGYNAGGTGTGGDYNIEGGQGASSGNASTISVAGVGGSSLLGSGGAGGRATGSDRLDGGDGKGYGAGGGGGVSRSGTDSFGGVGADGIIIVEEFYQ